jgi:hypothetical protein
VGIRRPNVGLGTLALSRIINSNKPAKTAALASPNITTQYGMDHRKMRKTNHVKSAFMAFLETKMS